MLPQLRKPPRGNALAILGCWNVLSVDLAFARGGVNVKRERTREKRESELCVKS